MDNAMIVRGPLPFIRLAGLPPAPPPVQLTSDTLQQGVQDATANAQRCVQEKAAVDRKNLPWKLGLGLSCTTLAAGGIVALAGSPHVGLSLAIAATAGAVGTTIKMVPLSRQSGRLSRQQAQWNSRGRVLDRFWQLLWQEPAPTAKPAAPRTVSEEVLDATGALVRALPDEEATEGIDRVWRMLRTAPNLSGAVVHQATAFVESSSSVEERRLKLKSVERLISIHPGISADEIGGISDYVQQSGMLLGRRLKLNSLMRLAAANPAMTHPDIVKSVGKFLKNAGTHEELALRLDYMEQIAAEKPDLNAATIDGLTEFCQSCYSSDELALRLECASRMFSQNPALDMQTLGAIQEAVTRNSDSIGRSLKLQGFTRIFEMNPQLDAPVVKELDDIVNDGHYQCSTAMRRMVELFEINPELSADYIRSVREEVQERDPNTQGQSTIDYERRFGEAVDKFRAAQKDARNQLNKMLHVDKQGQRISREAGAVRLGNIEVRVHPRDQNA